jgi:hypothetical protein
MPLGYWAAGTAALLAPLPVLPECTSRKRLKWPFAVLGVQLRELSQP